MTRQDLAAARVFEMTRNNPNLRTLVDAAQSIIAAKPEATSASDAMPK